MNYTFVQVCLRNPILEVHTYTFPPPLLMTMATIVL